MLLLFLFLCVYLNFNTNENSFTIVKELVIHGDGAADDDGAFCTALLWSTTSSCVFVFFLCVYDRP